MKKMTALMALTILTACDFAERADLRAEQGDSQYRAAMDDYRSGRVDAAVAGFEKVVRKDPSNASARFQLACLLQDFKRDYSGAYCGYCEYLLQQPGSDKAQLAKDRRAICEKALATALAQKYGLNSADAATEELEQVRQELQAAKARVTTMEKNMGETLARVRTLSAERERLLNIIKGTDVDAGRVRPEASVVEAKALLEEADEDATPAVRQDEVAQLKAEDGETSVRSSLLPVRQPNESVAEKTAEEKPKKPAVPEHPETYTVVEGDTLYGISKRFYGNISAWKRIREANKAIISADNRLKAGDTLVLP